MKLPVAILAAAVLMAAPVYGQSFVDDVAGTAHTILDLLDRVLPSADARPFEGVRAQMPQGLITTPALSVPTWTGLVTAVNGMPHGGGIRLSLRFIDNQNAVFVRTAAQAQAAQYQIVPMGTPHLNRLLIYFPAASITEQLDMQFVSPSGGYFLYLLHNGTQVAGQFTFQR